MRVFGYPLIVAVVSVLLLPEGAQAQSFVRMLARTGLVQEDVNIMVRTASTLYAAGNPQVGRDVIWSNPKTGAFGMAEVLEVEGDCVRIAYRFQTRRRPATQTVTTRRCLADGRWILAN